MSISTKEKEQLAAVFAPNCSPRDICPVKDIMASFSDKWSVYTVLLLGQHQCLRFSQLRSAISGISQRMLTVTLRALEADGIISRTIYPQVPPRVEYALTPLGEGLLHQLLHLARWAQEHADAILQARHAFENQQVQADEHDN